MQTCKVHAKLKSLARGSDAYVASAPISLTERGVKLLRKFLF